MNIEEKRGGCRFLTTATGTPHSRPQAVRVCQGVPSEGRRSACNGKNKADAHLRQQDGYPLTSRWTTVRWWRRRREGHVPGDSRPYAGIDVLHCRRPLPLHRRYDEPDERPRGDIQRLFQHGLGSPERIYSKDGALSRIAYVFMAHHGITDDDRKAFEK